MAQTNINIRMEENLKREFDTFCSTVGMTMTTAFCIFAKKVVMEQKIPFEISTDPFYSETNMKRLEKAMKEANQGKVTRHNLLKEENE